MKKYKYSSVELNMDKIDNEQKKPLKQTILEENEKLKNDKNLS